MSAPRDFVSDLASSDPSNLFQVIEKLGEGSYGEVYNALDKRTGNVRSPRNVEWRRGCPTLALECGHTWNDFRACGASSLADRGNQGHPRGVRPL